MNHRVLSFIFLFEFYVSTFNLELYNRTTIINSSRNKSAQFYTTKNMKIKLSNPTPVRPIFRTTSSKLKNRKKWQIERMTSKQYEIINLLRPKTKIFIDVDYSNNTFKTMTAEETTGFEHITPIPQNKQVTFTSSILLSKLLTTTPSYIEFYYLDSDDDKSIHNNMSELLSHKINKENQSDTKISRSRTSPVPSLFKIRINTIPPKQRFMEFERLKSFHKIDQSKYKPKSETVIFFTTPSTINETIRTKFTRRRYSNFKLIKTTSGNILTKRSIKESFGRKNESSLKLYPDIMPGLNVNGRNFKDVITTRSTIYDKVKFFEMYDGNTIEWQKVNNESAFIYDTELSIFPENRKIQLQHENEDTETQDEKNKTKYVRKYIQNFIHKDKKAENEMDTFINFSRHDINISTQTQDSVPNQKHPIRSRPAAWSEFPFVAVYIYEPLQVRCDAAGISPHWLLAAASCLSRHRRELHGGSLSALVTYCSDNWKQPRSISYVKRTIIHPRYHMKDKERRHLYNVGVIQVVNSMMDSCNGWTPVTLMSHQFTTGQEGTLATAVGWGLDRYVKLFTALEISDDSLMSYESLVYSESCPGSFENSYAKASNEDDAKNVFCVLLPPYVAEENDTVHGALLLIGGKLLALYLQEERRPWGVQSAQYTGIWGLVPWIIDTAREPDNLYTFQFQI